MFIDQAIVRQQSKSEERTKKEKLNCETPQRSLAKTISWRIIGTLDTILISWFITGTFAFAVSIGAIELFTKMVLYFFHERIWNTIKFGK